MKDKKLPESNNKQIQKRGGGVDSNANRNVKSGTGRKDGRENGGNGTRASEVDRGNLGGDRV